jgi:hypothetical protein
MKQEIICKECLPNLQTLFPTDNPYPGEHVKLVEGKAKNNFICDQCGKEIVAEDKCVAFSVWADYGGVPYYNWEGKYLSNFKIIKGR